MQAPSQKQWPTAANPGERIVILGTGGTIAGKASTSADNLGYTAAQIGVADLLAAVPGLAQHAGGCHLVAEQVAQIDSKDMSHAVWRDLLARVQQRLQEPQVRGIVITHGTDTLEETAYLLQTLLAPQKPVVLTAAMRPATSSQADGPQNLCDALAVAAHPGARGVLAVCGGVVHSALDVQKLYTYRLDAFCSGDAGPVGYVEEGNLRLVRNWPVAGVKYAQAAIDFIASGKAWPRVEIVLSHAGAGGAMVRALVADGVQGLVLAGTGNGTLHHELEAAARQAQAGGAAVLRCTRCALGHVLAGGQTGALPHAGALTPVKARIALMLELMGATA